MKLLQVFVLFGLALSGALYAADKSAIFDLQADRTRVDSATGELHAESASFSVYADQIIQAGKARVKGDAGGRPLIVDLEKVSFAIGQDVLGSADKATYYPEFKTLVAKQVWIEGLTGDVEHHCQNGTLYENGEAVPGNSTCINGVGGGSISISCSASGDRIQVVFSTESCPVE